MRHHLRHLQPGAMSSVIALTLLTSSGTAPAKVIPPKITVQDGAQGLQVAANGASSSSVGVDWIAQGAYKVIQPASAGAAAVIADASQALPQIERDTDGVWQAAPLVKSAHAADTVLLRRQILRAAAIHSIDPYLVKAVAWAESRYHPKAVSPKKAVGLMQVLPDTASGLGLRQVDGTPIAELLKDPWVSLLVGTRYLADQLSHFGGRTELALAAYNAGPGAVERAGMRIPNYPETQNYVRTVLAYCAAEKKARTLEGVV